MFIRRNDCIFPELARTWLSITYTYATCYTNLAYRSYVVFHHIHVSYLLRYFWESFIVFVNHGFVLDTTWTNQRLATFQMDIIRTIVFVYLFSVLNTENIYSNKIFIYNIKNNIDVYKCYIHQYYLKYNICISHIHY